MTSTYFFVTLTTFAVLLRAFFSLFCISPPISEKVKKATKSPAPLFHHLISAMILEETLAESNSYGKNAKKLLDPTIMAAIKDNTLILVIYILIN